MASCSRQWRSTSGRSRRGSRSSFPPRSSTPDQRGRELGHLHWHLDLPREATETIEVRVAPVPVGEPLSATGRRVARQRLRSAPHRTTPSLVFDRFIASAIRPRHAADQLPERQHPGGRYPVVHCPIRTRQPNRGLRTLHAYPDRIASTPASARRAAGDRRRPLARSATRKILHEMRYGDMGAYRADSTHSLLRLDRFDAVVRDWCLPSTIAGP